MFITKLILKNITMDVCPHRNFGSYLRTLTIYWPIVAICLPEVRSLHWQGWTFPTSALWVQSTVQTMLILVIIKPVLKARQKFFLSWECIFSFHGLTSKVHKIQYFIRKISFQLPKNSFKKMAMNKLIN